MVLLLIIPIGFCFNNNVEARRACNVDIEQVFGGLFHLDSEAAEGYLKDLKNTFSEDPESFYGYMEEFKRLGSILQLSDKNKDTYVHSIVRDLVVLAESLKEIEGGFNSLMNMVLNVAEIKKNAYFIYRIIRSLDVAVNDKGWSGSEGIKKHFIFSMEKLVQLAAGSDLKGEDILSQLQIFFHTAENDKTVENKKMEYSRLVEEFLFKNPGCCFNLPLLNASNGLGAVSFDWGSVLSLIMSNIEIRDNVRNMLTEFRERGIEVWIITTADAGKVCSRLEELDSDEDGSFCWSDCFKDRVVHASSAGAYSPADTKGAHLQGIVQECPGRVVIHFDDDPQYSNLGMIDTNLISIGVVATGVDDIDFRDKVSDLSGSAGIVVNLGFDYSKMFQALGL